MSEVRLTIDDRDVAVPEGSTLLEAAKQLGIEIPTLCHLEGLEPTTSCMICVVHDIGSDRLIPACSMPATEGMVIQTKDEQVRDARKDTLDLLLSEHVGDCEAPCQRACPAHMDVPSMVRLIQSQKMDEAVATVKGDIALPATLGRICPAPCEAGCNRKGHDGAVSVCMLKRYTADADLAQEDPFTPELQPATGKRVAIIGGGPTGLSAAYYLIQMGHAVHIHDAHPLLGGMLRYGVPEEDLPRSVLDAEIAQILALGVEFTPEVVFGKDITLEELRKTHDAVVLAFGTVGPDTPEIPGLDLARRGIAIKRDTYETSLDGVFAGGNAISESRQAIRALAHGKEIARCVDQFLSGGRVIGVPGRFASRIGKLLEGERTELLQIAGEAGRTSPAEGGGTGFDSLESAGESCRCLRCGCLKADDCRLRRYADEYGADQSRFGMGERQKIERVLRPGGRVIYEPGKCIKCGLCIQIAQKEGEELGLAFVGRGFNVRLAVPFNESFDDGLMKAAEACIAVCPTAALAWYDGTWAGPSFTETGYTPIPGGSDGTE